MKLKLFLNIKISKKKSKLHLASYKTTWKILGTVRFSFKEQPKKILRVNYADWFDFGPSKVLIIFP